MEGSVYHGYRRQGKKETVACFVHRTQTTLLTEVPRCRINFQKEDLDCEFAPRRSPVVQGEASLGWLFIKVFNGKMFQCLSEVLVKMEI